MAMTINTSTTNSNSKASNAQLKRAAGSQSLDELKQAIDTGWTAEEINTQEGKSALHMAAWKGCLENVQYLIDQVGCDINAYSVGEFNYGKTAIFYAATQSRQDVVDLLLDRNAKVTIVNNKGQSVLSLCATHEMSSSLLERIQALEEAQGDWWNFRASHSDGLEYGDLDPRFHTVRKTDVVTEFAVNPTTSKTRKGGFARRNPEEYEALTTRKEKQTPKKQRNQQRRRQAAELTQEEQEQLAQAWRKLEDAKWEDDLDQQRQRSISTIITLNDKQLQPWLPEAADRLKSIVETGICTLVQLLAMLEQIGEDSGNPRISSLVLKLLSRIQGDKEKVPDDEPSSGADKPTSACSNEIDWTAEPWKWARNQVEHLSVSLLERPNNDSILSLPQPPSFVNQLDQLKQLQQVLQQSTLLALDTEWRDTDDNQVALSTLQVALVHTEDPQRRMQAYVIDLMVGNDRYQQAAKKLIESLFSSNAVLLGFAFGNDLPLLQSYTGGIRLTSRYLLDIQKLLASKGRGNLPSLQNCAAQFSKHTLSKEQQCSDWGNRPFTKAQMEYAGLDAAILLFLLAEHIQRLDD